MAIIYNPVMFNVESLTRRFTGVFKPDQASALAEVITNAYTDLVKTSDFNELKAIVKQLAETQQRTEMRMGELTEAQQRTETRVNQLAEAQQRTEARLGELAEAQQRTEARLGELAEAQQRTETRLGELAKAQQRTESNLAKLTVTVTGLAQEVGGLSRSASYALENEAYRLLPAFLQKRYGITLREPIIRTEISGEEVNFFASGSRDGSSVCLVGETKLQLDERRNTRRQAQEMFAQLERKVQAVQRQYPDCEIVRMLVTHYVRPAVVKQAQENGVIIVQSFEW